MAKKKPEPTGKAAEKKAAPTKKAPAQAPPEILIDGKDALRVRWLETVYQHTATAPDQADGAALREQIERRAGQLVLLGARGRGVKC